MHNCVEAASCFFFFFFACSLSRSSRVHQRDHQVLQAARHFECTHCVEVTCVSACWLRAVIPLLLMNLLQSTLLPLVCPFYFILSPPCQEMWIADALASLSALLASARVAPLDAVDINSVGFGGWMAAQRRTPRGYAFQKLNTQLCLCCC